MGIFIPQFEWNKLDREEVAYGTCRGLRIVRVGRVFFVEQAQIERDEKGETIAWKVAAVAKDQDPRKAYLEAAQWLAEANIEVLKVSGGARGRPAA